MKFFSSKYIKKIYIFGIVFFILPLTSCNDDGDDLHDYPNPLIATTTSDFSGIEGFETDKEKIKAIYDAGFKYVDFSLYSLSLNDEYMKENWEEKILDLKEYADNLGVKFVQAHSPGGNPCSTNEDEVDSLIKTTKRSIEICGVLGIPNTVVHAGTNESFSKEKWLESNKNFYAQILPVAKENNVNVLCENTTTKNIGKAFGLTNADRMLEFIQYVDHQNFHACWDVGHGNCERNQISNINKLGKEIFAIHLDDNFGNQDSHLLPYCGNADFRSIVKALDNIGFEGYYSFEADGSNRNIGWYHGKDFSELLGLPKGTSVSSLNRIEQEKWLFYLAKRIYNFRNIKETE